MANKPGRSGRFFDGKNKECGNCGEIKPTTEFHPTVTADPSRAPISSDFRTHCKPCRSAITYRQQMEKKLKAYPNSFWECPGDDCIRINRIQVLNCLSCGGEKP